MNVPATVGVPLIVIVLLLKVAVTPVGKPVGVPMFVAPVVEMVTAGFIGALIHTDGFAEGAAAVFTGFTVMVPVALTVPHPPVNGIV